MTDITYISPDGTSTTLEARLGDSVMEVAVKHGVEGIVAECGGACSCATCHVYVDEAFTDRVGGAGDLEDDMLDGAAAERLPNSRLSCQIKMRDELDGLLVRIAPEQL
jgi:2Fe-2S ferredoxin